jgi:beta-lactamase class C
MIRFRLLLLCFCLAGAPLLFLLSGEKESIAASSPQPKRDSLAKKEFPIVRKEDPEWNQLFDRYGKFIQQAIDSQLAPGVAVAIIKDSSIIFMKGFGYRNTTTKDPIDTETVFRLGSVSKCFASVLSGVLVQEKVLSWNDPVVHYLPGFALKSKEQTEGIQLRHVLSHTTGLPYHAFTDLIERGTPFDTMVYHLRDLTLVGKPGQIYSYQNVAYSVIGQVMQAATGKTYEQVMHEKIFTPLQMTHASLSYQALMKETNVAKPHRLSAKGWVTQPFSTTYYNVGPAGGMNASINDMALFLTSLMKSQGSLLDSTQQEAIFQPVVKATAKNRYFWTWKRPVSSHYGLGWRVINFKDDVVNYHGGYVNGFRSEVAIHRKDRIAICVLVNAPGQLADQAIPEFFKRYDQLRLAKTQLVLKDSVQANSVGQ